MRKKIIVASILVIAAVIVLLIVTRLVGLWPVWAIEALMILLHSLTEL